MYTAYDCHVSRVVLCSILRQLLMEIMIGSFIPEKLLKSLKFCFKTMLMLLYDSE